MLSAALGLVDARLIALVGAGGKTTVMLALAREWAAGGAAVVVTTTTRLAAEEGEAARAANITLSHAGRQGDKLLGHPPEAVDALKAKFDRVLVEADGSRRKPLKAPAAHEPVIPSLTDAVVVVAGLSGLGLPLNEANVFRAERWAELSGTAMGALVTAESLARVALHPEGLARGCGNALRTVLFLNQGRMVEARAIAALLAAAPSSPFARVVGGALLPTPRLEVLHRVQ